MRPLDDFYNPFDQKIYALNENSINTYSLRGEFLGALEMPKLNEASVKEGYIKTSIDAFIDKETNVCYINNFTGSIARRLVILNKTSELKSYPQYEKWSSDQVPNRQNPIFATWNNMLTFKEMSNDTVFSISTQELSPRFVLFSGDSKYPYTFTRKEALEQMSEPKDYFIPISLFENSKYLFFDLISRETPSKTIRNFCVFDKTNKKTLVCKNNIEYISSGFTDDINNFLPITPITITNTNELIAILQPLDIVSWKNKNTGKLSELKTKLPWIERINEMDNPVIVIGKCKD
jgi:hypothetical protein